MRFFIFAIILSSKLFAQDTIFTAEPTPLLVRVLELSKAEVKYKIFYNPDGVIRSIANSEVKKIVYENGVIEAKFLNKSLLKVIPLNEEPKFILENEHLSYNNKDLSHNQALAIMLKRDIHFNSEKLNTEIIGAESKKNKQVGCLVLSPLAVIGGVYFAYRYQKFNYTGKETIKTSKAILLSGLGVGVACLATGLIFKALKNKQIKKAALLYNNDL